MISSVTLASGLHSLPIKDRAKIGYFFDDQEIKLLSRYHEHHVYDRFHGNLNKFYELLIVHEVN